MLRIFALLCTLFVSLPAMAQYAPANAEWNQPMAPFRIADNLYYVGVKGLAVYLIVTPAGDILLDTGYQETAPLVEASVRKLGFHVSDIHILLSSHAHSDHAGGFRAMKEATHARLLASPGDAPLLERGGRDDFAFANRARFPPVKVDALLEDGVPVRLGGVAMTPHFTPGHTRGCTTWTMDVARSRTTAACRFCLQPLCARLSGGEQSQVSGDAQGLQDEYSTMRTLPCDIFLAAHPWQFGMDEKLARLKAHPDGPNPFVDPAGYKAYLDESEADLNKMAAEQSRKQSMRKPATAGR